jgi:hypothetical protein
VLSPDQAARLWSRPSVGVDPLATGGFQGTLLDVEVLLVGRDPVVPDQHHPAPRRFSLAGDTTEARGVPGLGRGGRTGLRALRAAFLLLLTLRARLGAARSPEEIMRLGRPHGKH